jgi:hypothetical protein
MGTIDPQRQLCGQAQNFQFVCVSDGRSLCSDGRYKTTLVSYFFCRKGKVTESPLTFCKALVKRRVARKYSKHAWEGKEIEGVVNSL